MYSIKECIFDFIAACGPQEVPAIVREVMFQSTELAENQRPVTPFVERALFEMCKNDGLLIRDHDDDSYYYELSDYGYELIAIAHDRIHA